MNRTDFIVYKSAGIEIRKILLIDLFYLWQNYVKNTTPKNWKIGKHSELVQNWRNWGFFQKENTDY